MFLITYWQQQRGLETVSYTHLPDDAYAYDTVSASSSALKKNLVCNGFVNGWTEFGIIRAYLNDDRLDDNLRNYLIASTRMTYALYGVADISVHAGGWGEAEVTDLCTTYFGEAGGSSYGSRDVYKRQLLLRYLVSSSRNLLMQTKK